MRRAYWRTLLSAALALPWIAAAAHAQEGTLKLAHLGRCPLASGDAIEDCQVGYRTMGTLDAAHSNVVVMGTWLNGRSDALLPLFGSEPGDQRLVDTTRFFGVAFDAFGDGVSSSPSNSPHQHGIAFPVFTIEDMVRAQYRVLTEVLHVQHVHAAIGVSMGGHQVFAWAALYPHFIDKAVPIVGSPQVTNFDRLSKQLVIDSIEADPDYQGGNYTQQPALKLANALGALMLTTPEYRNAQAPRGSYREWLAQLQAPQQQDANDRVWQAKAILLHDVLHGHTLAEAARASPVKFLVINAAEDRMVTPDPAMAWAKAAGAPSYLSPGACAHLIMNCDAAEVQRRVASFLH